MFGFLKYLTAGCLFVGVGARPQSAAAAMPSSRSSRVQSDTPKAVSSTPNLKVEGLVKGLMAEITEDYSVEVRLCNSLLVIVL